MTSADVKTICLPSEADVQLKVMYRDIKYRTEILSLAATNDCFNRLDRLGDAFDQKLSEIRQRSSSTYYTETKRRGRLFIRIIMASLSRETRNPIIPSSNLDFSDLDQLSRSHPNEDHDELRQLLMDGLEEAVNSVESRLLTDDDGVVFRWQKRNNYDRNGFFEAVDRYGSPVDNPQKCSSFVYDRALRRWRRNSHLHHLVGDARLTFERIMFLLLLRYRRLYRYMVLNELSTHPSVFKRILLDQGTSVGCEMYGSALNAHLDIFGSLFYDLEKHFGSIGSAAFIQPICGVFTVDLVPSPSVFEELRTKNWFAAAKETTASLYIYIKMQGGWGTENDLLRRMQDRSFLSQFHQLLRDYQLPVEKTETILAECLKIHRRNYYNRGEEDPVDLILGRLKNSPYFIQHCFFPACDFQWANYMQMQCLHNCEVVIYLLSNNPNAKHLDLSNVRFEVPREDFLGCRQKIEPSRAQESRYALMDFCKEYLKEGNRPSTNTVDSQ